MITRSKKVTRAKPRRNFLNKSQRKELRLNLIDRYTKDFGLRHPEIVKEMVNSFFKSSQELNSKTLSSLEQRVKRAILRGKSEESMGEKRRESQVQQTLQNKLSSEDRKDSMENQDPLNGLRNAVLNKIENEKRQKVVNGELGLDYLDGILEEEMGLMSKNSQKARLKSYLEEQERIIQNRTKVLGQKMVRQELDLQKKEKNEKRAWEQEENKKYEIAIREKIREDQEKKRQKDLREQEEKKRTRKLQDKIIQDRRQNLRLEKEKEEQENQKLVEAIKMDLEYQNKKEQELFKVKTIINNKQIRRQNQKEIMKENEIRRKKKKEQEKELNRQEAEIQRKANQIGEAMEKARLQELENKKKKMHKLFVQ